MLTYEDCLGLCELTEDEVAAIAEHEHCSEMIAAELGAYLVSQPDGPLRIQRMILDDIEHAQQRHKHAHAARLKLVLKRFCEAHPEVRQTREYL